jgi:hypothetical protein
VSSRESVEELYVRTLTRFPTAAELKAWESMLTQVGGPPEELLEDLLWCLLNSREFAFNR